uniref:Cilia and flagella associated protein 74 n=1 Tax=Lepisosteus oculatus TaxID=7918 RepID=W5MG58_LEPOC
MSAVSAGHTPLQSGWTDDDQSADEEADKEGFRDEDTLFPTSADEFGGFSSSSSWEEEEADLTEDQDRSKKKSYAERVRIFKLRRNLDQLDSFYKQKEHDVLKAREELKACRLRIAELGKQRDVVERDIEELKESENTAALFRLRALHKRLCSELQGEEDLESQIEMALTQNELELCQVEVELGRFSHLRQEVQREEQALEVQQEQQAARRLRQEETAARAAELRHRLEKKRQMNSLKEREAQHRKAVVEAQQNHKKAVLYLKETMNRIRQKEAEEEMQSREQMERRVQAVLSLKTNIAATRENLHALQARDKARIARQKEKERLVRESVRAEGGDVTKYMHQQKQLRELERKKRAFEEQQKSRKIQIISKILQEEALLEKRKKYQAQHFPTYRKSLDKASYSTKTREKLLEYLDLTYGEADEESYSPVSRKTYLMKCNGSPERDDSEEERTTEESLAVPEFTGLWEQKHKEYKVQAALNVKMHKMDQEILARTLEKQRSGIVRKQVVVGREFKGCPFYSKPEVIHFKDFDVGKTYKKRVTLTNVSYSINFCKLLGVSEHLKDFISVHFEPPGAMSAGMSCDMLVTFKPMINKDLDGKVQFLSQTGPFSVSLKCTIKKCELAVDNSLIDFGTHVVGETISRVITLTNRGTLGTHFILVPSSDSGPVQLVSEPFSMEPEKIRSLVTTTISPVHRWIHTVFRIEKKLVRKMSNLFLKITKTQGTEAFPVIFLCDVLSIFQVQEGEIGPLSCIKLQIIFTPTIPGDVQMAFDIRFSDPSAQPIPITVRGVAIDLPVWVAQPNVDLKICMYDRLYQDSIVVHSRSSTALRLTFVVCKELRNHLEILPKTGFIQAQSTFNVQLKFLPRHSLPDDTGACFDKETGVLEVPLMIQVADQARPVPFTVHAVVTTSDLEFGRKELDFGHCSIYESVRTSVLLTNHSLLPQDFGFVGIPKFIDVQPNDGFGTLLPLETLEIDIIFSPTKAREYSFELTCKSGINRDFKLSCRAVGVHPPLELSHSLVQFGATAVNDMSTATLYVVNSHTSSNEFTHPVPRIGRGEIAPVGPTSFEFINPDNSDITITPEVGTVMPGKRCLVQVSFRPSISDEAIREEAVRSKKEAQSELKRGKKQPNPASAKTAVKEKCSKVSVSPKICSPFEPPNPRDIHPESETFAAAKASLLRSFADCFKSYTVPCFVASGETTDGKNPEHLQYSPHNTLYLELHCPIVRPPLVVVSDNGRTSVNFNEVATGQKVVRRVTIQNISQDSLDLSSSLLDPNGPFLLLNALRHLEPGAMHTLLISFSPAQGKKYYETLQIQTKKMTLRLNLCGIGLQPTINCSVEGGLISFGYVLEKESATQMFKLHNTSSLLVHYSLKLESLSNFTHEGLPPFLASGLQSQAPVGTQNYSGLSVFSVSPIEGAISPGKSQDITVTFQPDHESLYYSDRLKVELMNKQTVQEVQLKGAARRHTMYVSGGDPLDVPVESLAFLPPDEESTAVLLTLKSVYSESTVPPAVRELEVGCIRSTQPMVKKNVEFALDNLPVLQQKGFSVDPVKGTVEPGQKKTITVTWAPHSGQNLTQPLCVSVPLTVKGDVTEIYNVTLLALVVRAPESGSER